MPKKDVHVMPRPDGWAVKIAGNEKASKITETQKQAIEYAEKRAKSNSSEVVIHRKKDNSIREKNSYGNDPKNIRG